MRAYTDEEVLALMATAHALIGYAAVGRDIEPEYAHAMGFQLLRLLNGKLDATLVSELAACTKTSPLYEGDEA